jgi:di/tricarboxylate transporter
MSQTTMTKVEHLGTVDLTREKEVRPIKNYWKAIVPVLVGVALLFLPIPEGLKPSAWYYFALFVAVVIALIFEPIPAAAVGLIGVTTAAVSLLVMPKPPTPSDGRFRDFRTARFGSFSSPLCSR